MKRILLLALIIITGAYLLTFDARNEKAFRELIGDSSKQTITRLTLKYQQREVECSDKEILAVLLELMRHGEPVSIGGVTYDATLVTSNGRRLGCLMYFSEQSLAVSVGGGIKNFDNNIRLLKVGVPQDLPRNFQVLLDFLLASHESVGGTRLIPFASV